VIPKAGLLRAVRYKGLFTSAVCTFLLLISAARISAQCNSERWSIKTGTDADASLINLSAKTSTTIANLRAIAAPSTIPDENRIKPTETTVWVISATLVKFIHAYDSDYHMVLADSAGRTMIAEIPDPDCVGPGSPLAAGIAHARAQFDARFSASDDFQTVNVPVQITGVGFFDYQEGQEGVAPNAIELHPIIDIIFQPTFTLTSSAQSMTVARGGAGTATITSTVGSGFNSTVTLSATGLPSGATATFSPSSFAAPGSGSSNLSIAAGASTPPGSYNVTVTGTGGGQTHTTAINLNVTTAQQLLANPGFENGSGSPAPWTVSSGVIDNSGFEAPHTGSWKAWLDGYGSTHTDTLLQSVSIPSTATTATLSFWLHIDTKEVAAVANDTLRVQIRNTSGTVLSTLATYSNLNAASGYSAVSFDVTTYRGQTVQVYLIGNENSSLKTSFVVDDFALTVTTSGTPPDFSISASPSSLSITQSGSGASTISTTIAGSFNSSIALSASGLPAGATANFSPDSMVAAPGNGSATMTILAGSATATGNYNVTVTGTGGGITHSTTVALTVTGSSGGSTQQLLGNPGFENGSSSTAPWTVSSGVIDNNSTKEPAHGGTWKAWLDGYGSDHTDTLLQTVTIPSTATSVSLAFWLHIDTKETTTTRAYDTLKVQVRNSSGSTLATLATYSNLNAGSGYHQVSFDLSSYRGQTIQIYLIGVEDSSLQTSFVVDDFTVNAIMP
jgi:uncharacterized membrane protein